MELLDGDTLRAFIASGPLPVRKAVEIAAQISRTAGLTHAAGAERREDLVGPRRVPAARGMERRGF